MNIISGGKLLAIGLWISSLGAAQAATVDLGYDLEVEYQTVHGIRDNTSTYIYDLLGSTINAVFADGSTETFEWEMKPNGAAGILGGQAMHIAWQWWGLELTTTNHLASLSFDLGPSGTIFDTGGREGREGNTPGTKGGYPLHFLEALNGATDTPDTSMTGVVNATYSGLVQLANHAPGTDAFTRLMIDFSGVEGGGILGAVTMAFDMDVLEYGADDLTPVPLPAGMSLLLAALAAFGLMGAAQNRQRIKLPVRA